MLMDTRVRELRHQLLAWWQEHGRHTIPWKRMANGARPGPGDPLDPYPIWVAEVMLQQTQLQVVLPYWQRWMARFPSLEALAAAEEHAVLLLWQGLGYYSRARRLHQGARQMLGQPWPQDLEGWLALPGIGRSTAGSILSSAFDLPFAILDGNVKRVLARLIASPRPPARELAGFWRLSEELLDPQQPRAFNQALMDLGATVCTPRNPRCGECPWREHCAAYAAGDPAQYPVKDASKPLPFQVIGVGVVLNGAGQVLIDQRLNEGLLGGLWEFPGGKQEPGEAIEATIARELMEELAITVEVGEELISLEHAYSHKRLRFVVHLCQWQSGEPQPLACQQVQWVEPAQLSHFPFPAANARIIAALLERLGLQAPQPPQVICLGEALVDRLGPLGGDPATAPAELLDDRLGGAPANVACALARLGTPTAFVGRLGEDAIGEAFVELLTARGVDLSALQRDANRPSRIVLVHRDATGERSFGGFAGDQGLGFADQALEQGPLEQALPPLLTGAQWLQIGSIPLASPTAAQALHRAAALARAHGVAVALDVNWRPTFWDPAATAASGPPAAAVAAMRPLLDQAALLKLAAEEAQWLFSSRDPKQVAAALPQRPAVVITDGGQQLAWCFGAHSGSMPAFAVEVVDSTGAGDAFLAGLLHRLCAEPDLLSADGDGAIADRLTAAIRFASACGALVCQGAGGIDPQPAAEQVAAFVRSTAAADSPAAGRL
jgi:A/G-specific adenine glycosylase